MRRLDGRTAVITGGSSGIGLATARLFAREGARVAIVGRNASALEKARLELLDGEALAVPADLSALAGVERLMDKVEKAFGRIDVLFANAGVSDSPPWQEAGEADFAAIMDANVKSVFFTFAKAFPLLAEHASVIFTSSVAHGKGRPGDPLYSATKAAVRSLGRTLALDEAVLGKRVRVNVISPGAIQTPLTLQDSPEMEKAINAYISGAVPMKRWGRAEEVAEAALFLASPASAYLTGGEITVDGGLAQT
ncbi:MAG TPA: SDR family oxidoreductase [Fibrobacteria bacterium]|nr:SDR family oxidoreductase [Fibrobacteria bacterium]